MNIYIVIEGEKAMKKLYKTWISYVNPQLSYIDYPTDFQSNNYYILAGYGQPGYWGRVENAVRDVNKNKAIDRLVLSIDSEDKTYDEKLLEVQERVKKMECRVDVKYIIQHFCIETWLLGNAQIFRKHPLDDELLNYLAHFDVRGNDPELLPVYPPNSWNRAQFAFRYLKAGLRDIYSGRKYYTKSNPGVACEEGYFYQVRSRYQTNKHIQSFGGFLTAFI